MDEYAEHIYQRRPEYRHLSAGDVAAQKKLRSSLNCKSFKWFMTQIAWDLPKFYPPVEPPAAAWGEVSRRAGPLQSAHADPVHRAGKRAIKESVVKLSHLSRPFSSFVLFLVVFGLGFVFLLLSFLVCVFFC